MTMLAKRSPKTATIKGSRIDQLSTDPFPSQSAKLQRAERLYRLRVGDYRIIYEVDHGARRLLLFERAT